MEKPRKKETRLGDGRMPGKVSVAGYNEALNDINKWLPTEDEIVDILIGEYPVPLNSEQKNIREVWCKTLAKAIMKRLGGGDGEA